MIKTQPLTALLFFFTLLTPALHGGIPSFVYKEKSDTEKEGLLGKVKSAYQTEYNGQKPHGTLVKGEILGYNDTRYDEHGYAVEIRCRRYEDELNNEITTTYVNKYSEEGKRVEQSIYNDKDSLLAQIFYKYDKLGNITEKETYSPKGQLNIKYVYVYNDKGNMAESLTYNSHQTISKRYVFEYDDEGKMFESNGYEGKDTWRSKLVYRYDGNGNLAEYISSYYRADEEHTQIRGLNEYDSAGNVIEAYIFGLNNTLQMKYAYKHNEKGNAVEEHVVDLVNNQDITQQIEYKYDSYGNWVQIATATFSKDTPTPFIEIKERVIEYYE